MTTVRISPDLKVAKVYLSIFQAGKSDNMLEEVRSHQGNIRRILGNEVKNQLRYIPELHFYLDDSLDYAEEIDSLLNLDD